MELTRGDIGIKTEWKEAFRWAISPPENSLSTNLADLALHLLAKLLQSEFRREHKTFKNYDATGHLYTSCVVCGIGVDPRHEYDEAAWIDAAKGVLGG